MVLKVLLWLYIINKIKILDIVLRIKNGNYNISLIPKLQDSSRIEISCLGYQKLVHGIDLRIQNHDFMLRQKIDTLKEVVIKSGKKLIEIVIPPL